MSSTRIYSMNCWIFSVEDLNYDNYASSYYVAFTTACFGESSSVPILESNLEGIS
jgi:hypothetical protein